jgi:hypothetical protein
LQVIRTNLPRTFASLTEYCVEQELQTIIKPTSSLSPLHGGCEPNSPSLALPHDLVHVVATSDKRGIQTKKPAYLWHIVTEPDNESTVQFGFHAYVRRHPRTHIGLFNARASLGTVTPHLRAELLGPPSGKPRRSRLSRSARRPCDYSSRRRWNGS